MCYTLLICQRADLQSMNEVPFETALGEHVEDMLDACR